MVPAEATRVSIANITIVDDNINEEVETFVLVAKILGRAANVSCFQLHENSLCKSVAYVGGVRLTIRDDDGRFCTVV